MASINGQEYQHALIRLNILAGAPLRIKTFSKLNFKPTAEKKSVMDSQGQQIGWTLDNQKYEGNLTLLRSEWLTVKTQVLQQNSFPAQLGILQCRTDWDVSYGNAFVDYKTVSLYGVMFQSDPFDSENNQDPLYVDVPLFILGSKDENGLAPVVYL